MHYKKEDIDFSQITPRAFENLCYDLILKYNFQNLIWREGGADNGRDIEGSYIFQNTIKNKETKWFFECKHYTAGGVPPEHLNSKIAWADAEMPTSLVIFISSYLTNSARTWLDKIKPQKAYDIICIEGEDIKDRLLVNQDLIERYFSLSRYEQLLKEMKDINTKFKIKPSYEVLNEIIYNIDLTKLDEEDFGFLLFNFFEQYEYFENREEYFGDFEPELPKRIFEFLAQTIKNEKLTSFESYQQDYIQLAGGGIFDEMELSDTGEEVIMKRYYFQHEVLHLNYSQTQENWKLGFYLFIVFKDIAFEILKIDKTEIRIIPDFIPEKISLISLKKDESFTDIYKAYSAQFNL